VATSRGREVSRICAGLDEQIRESVRLVMQELIETEATEQPSPSQLE